MMNSLSKTDDFIQMIHLFSKTDDFVKMINLFNKTDDFIKSEKNKRISFVCFLIYGIKRRSGHD